MTPLSIIHILDYASLENLGGDCQVAFETAAALVRRGHRVAVFGGNEEGGRDFTWRGVRIVSFHYEPEGWGGLRTLRAVGKAPAARFREVFAGEKFDVAAFHQPLVSRAFRSRDLLGDACRVYYFHSPWHLEYAAGAPRSKGLRFLVNSRFRRRIEKKALMPARCVIVLSEYMKDLAARCHGRPAESIRVIPGGVDAEQFREADDLAALRRGLDLPADRPVLFCLRRLVPRMGIDNLLGAMPEVLKAHPEVLLLVGGRGPQEAELRGLADTLGIAGNVRFLGYVKGGDAQQYYAAADASVVPTRELEGFGLVLLESLASGTPVLATPVGGMPEILRPLRPEWIFRDNTPDAIAEGIRTFLSAGSVTPEVRRDCRNHAARNYTWDRTAEETETLFCELTPDN